MKATEIMAKFGLNELSQDTLNASPIAERGGKLENGSYVFDVIEDGKIVAGEKPFGGYAVRYFAANHNGKVTTIIASQLWRMAYTSDAVDAKAECVCDAAKHLRDEFRGLSTAEICGHPSLLGKTIEVTGTRTMYVKKDRNLPFGPENCESREYPVFEIK